MLRLKLNHVSKGGPESFVGTKLEEYIVGIHDDDMTWKSFPHYWSFVRLVTGGPVTKYP